ncbi:MAG TPA: HPP family protein [Longimicrobium sp.]|nr:HPP family protein [Longimicrobium sp.]
MKRSLEPGRSADRAARRRLDLKGEFTLAALPTITVLLVLGMVEVLSSQRVLFASLASSAFLIYLDPEHGTNSVRSLVVSQLTAAVLGLVTYMALGPGYLAGGLAMLASITVMIVADAVYPPAVGTSLAFAFRAGDESNLLLFGLALGVTALLVLMERATIWLLARAPVRVRTKPKR